MDPTPIQTEQVFQRFKYTDGLVLMTDLQQCISGHLFSHFVRSHKRKNADRYIYLVYAPEWPSTVSQSVNLRSKLACALGHGGGGGNFPLVPIPTDGEMEASVSVWECNHDVTRYTASSSNPAGTFATETQFRYHWDGAACPGIIWNSASHASGIQSNEN